MSPTEKKNTFDLLTFPCWSSLVCAGSWDSNYALPKSL